MVVKSCVVVVLGKYSGFESSVVWWRDLRWRKRVIMVGGCWEGVIRHGALDLSDVEVRSRYYGWTRDICCGVVQNVVGGRSYFCVSCIKAEIYCR